MRFLPPDLLAYIAWSARSDLLFLPAAGAEADGGRPAADAPACPPPVSSITCTRGKGDAGREDASLDARPGAGLCGAVW